MLLIPSLAWSKCFSYKITELALSKEPVEAMVTSYANDQKGHCELTLKFQALSVSGSAEGNLCKLKIGDKVKVKVNTFCCDTQDCDSTMHDRIWFTEQ